MQEQISMARQGEEMSTPQARALTKFTIIAKACPASGMTSCFSNFF